MEVSIRAHLEDIFDTQEAGSSKNKEPTMYKADRRLLNGKLYKMAPFQFLEDFVRRAFVPRKFISSLVHILVGSSCDNNVPL